MSVKSEQRLYYSVEQATQQPVVDGTQSVLPIGFQHYCEFFANFVNQGELQDTIDSAIPAPYVLEGEPSVQEIDVIRHYTVAIRGIYYSNNPAASSFESRHSGNFY